MGSAQGTRTRYDLALRQLTTLGVLTAEARVRDLLRDDWSDRMKNWDVAPATKNGVRRAVSRFLSRYLGDKHHDFRRHVLHEDRWPKVDEPRRIRGFAVEQFWPLMKEVPQHLVPSYVLLAATGMRIGEFLNDDAIAVDEINHTITVTGKTGQHVYAIARPAWPYVRAAVPCRVARRRGTTPPASIQEDPRYKKLYRRLRDAGDAIGVRVTIHDLRRLFARLGVASDGETATQTAMGHKTLSMTREYARWNTQHQVAASVAEALGLGEQMSGKKSGNSKRNKAARGGAT